MPAGRDLERSANSQRQRRKRGDGEDPAERIRARWSQDQTPAIALFNLKIVAASRLSHV
jgi:hypothetical protein